MENSESDPIGQLTGQIMILRGNINTMSDRMEEFISLGFPNGDLDGHRRYHQNVIEWQELRSQLVRAALIKAAQSGGVLALGWICYALWVSFKFGVTH